MSALAISAFAHVCITMSAIANLLAFGLPLAFGLGPAACGRLPIG
jgi:hypothetical protein